MEWPSWVPGMLINHAGWKLLALASAVVIWALVASEPELSTFRTAPVEYRNLPDDIEISSPPMETVSLELRGPAGELGFAGETRRPAVIIDLSGVTPGEHTFSISEANVNLPRTVQMVRAIPSEIRIDFEHRLSRNIPVQVRFTGEGSNGYVVAQTKVSPDTVAVEGPASHVQRLRAAVTDPIDVSSLYGMAQFHVNAFIPDPAVRLETSPQITVSVTMRKGPQK